MRIKSCFRPLGATGAGFSLLLNLSLALHCQAAGPIYTFTHLAGPKALGPGHADGIREAAQFNLPWGVGLDSTGNVYVADWGNDTIRKVTPDGIVTTVAGSPQMQGSDDGVGQAARFRTPEGVVCDRFGNLFVADAANYTIRKIKPDGTVTTFAGTAGQKGSVDGNGSAARFNYPSGIAIDSTDTLYVSDMLNNVIRRITPDANVTTWAGTLGKNGSADGTGTSAQFGFIGGLAVNAVGEVYVADTTNHTIRKITPSGEVTTFAGSAGEPDWADGSAAAARFSLPQDVAVDAPGNLYIMDRGNNAVRKITPAAVVTTVAGQPGGAGYGAADGVGTAAHFNQAEGIAADLSGNLYIADTQNSTLRKIAAGNIVTTFAGSTRQPGTADGLGAAARFSHPAGVTVDQAGNAYIADTRNNTIRKITRDGEVSTLAGSPGNAGAADGTGPVARFNAPNSIAIDAAGVLYVADTNNFVVRKILPDGLVSTLAGSGHFGYADGMGPDATFSIINSITLDVAGNIYVADATNSAIRRIAPDGTVTTYVRDLLVPSAIAMGRDGDLYWADLFNHCVKKISSTGVVTTIAGSVAVGYADGLGAQALFSTPRSIAVDQAGTIFVVDDTTIRRIASNGTVTTIGGMVSAPGSDDGIGSSARFSGGDAGIAVDAAGNLYITDADNNVIRKGISAVAPAILTQPISQTVAVGQTVTFECSAANAVSYQWTKNGVVISNALSSTLVLKNVNLSDAGDYAVLLENSDGGSVLSDSAKLTVSATASARLINIASRSYVGTGDDVMIAGFVIAGDSAKTVLVRAAGPALAKLAISNILVDPLLELHDSSHVLAANDNWSDDAAKTPALRDAFGSTGAFAWDEGSKDAALLTVLNPGAYTAVVSGVGGSTGVALVEVYEVDGENRKSRLVNIATRSLVKTGDEVLIAGFVISGETAKTVIIRAAGPSLRQSGVGNALDDPMLEVHNASRVIGTNNDWDASLLKDFQTVGAHEWISGSKDAALTMTLQPGPYTAIVSGKNGSTGVGLVEIYEED